MKKTILLMAVCLCFIGNASAQWVVSDPGNLAQGIINTTKQIVQTSTTAKNTLDGFMEAQKIFQQGKVYYDALKAVHDVVKGGIKVKKSIELVAEISEIYVRNFQNMLADPNFTPDELSAISFGYAKLMSESSDVLQDLKNVVNVTGMSLTDASMAQSRDVSNGIQNWALVSGTGNTVLNPCRQQVIEDGHPHIFFEEAAAFTFAQSGVGGDIFETEFFRSMLLKIRKNVFQTL